MEIQVISGSSRNALSSINVNSFTMLSVPAYARAMEFLSSNLASFPVEVLQDEVKTDATHALDKILRRKANPTQTSHSFWKQLYFDGEHRGNGYGYIRRASPTSTDIIGLYNLLPDDVTPYRLIPADGSMFDAAVFYWHAPSKIGIPAADILHYRPGLSYDGLVGYSPAQLWAGTFARAQALQVFQTKYLLKGSWIKGSVEMPTGTTEEQANAIIANVKKFRAEIGDRDIIALSGGATLKNQTADAQQMQLIEQDEAVTKKVAQMTGVGQQFLFDNSELKYNAASVEAVGQDVVRFTFRTRIENAEDEITSKLLTEEEIDAGYSIQLDTSALLRGDTAVQMTVATTGVNQGLITPNEGRIDVGLQPDPAPESDKLRLPTHLVANPAATEAETHAKEPAPDVFAAFRPLLDDAVSRVETKTEKAFTTANKKTPTERIIYCNVLAEEQASYAAEALAPIAMAITTITGKTLDVAKISESYSHEIRRRSAGETAKTLAAYVEDAINGSAA